MMYQLMLIVTLGILSNCNGFVLPDFDGEIAMDDAPFVVEDLVLPTDPTIIEKEEMQDSTVKGDETFSELFEKYDQTYNSNDKYGTSGDFKNDVLETIQTIVHEAKQGKDLKNPMTLMNQEAILSSNDTSMKRHHQELSFGHPLNNIANQRDAIDELKLLLDSKRKNSVHIDNNQESFESIELQQADNNSAQKKIVKTTKPAEPGIIQNIFTSVIGAIDRFNDSQMEKEKKFRRNLNTELLTNELNESDLRESTTENEELTSNRSSTIETIQQISDSEVEFMKHTSVSEENVGNFMVDKAAVVHLPEYEKNINDGPEAKVEEHVPEILELDVTTTAENVFDTMKSEQVELDLVEKIIYSSVHQETSSEVTSPTNLLTERVDFNPIEIMPKDWHTRLRAVNEPTTEASNDKFMGFLPNEDLIKAGDESTSLDKYFENEVRTTTESVVDLVKDALEFIAILGRNANVDSEATTMPSVDDVEVSTMQTELDEVTTDISKAIQTEELSRAMVSVENSLESNKILNEFVETPVTTAPNFILDSEDKTEIWEVNTKISVSFASADDSKLVETFPKDIQFQNIFKSKDKPEIKLKSHIDLELTTVINASSEESSSEESDEKKNSKIVQPDIDSMESSENTHETVTEQYTKNDIKSDKSSEESSEEGLLKEEKSWKYDKSRLELLLNSEIKENSSESKEKQIDPKSSESIEDDTENISTKSTNGRSSEVMTTLGPVETKSEKMFEEIFYYSKDHDVRKKDHVNLISFENEINGIAEYIDHKVQAVTEEPLPITADNLSKTVLPTEDFVYGVVVSGPKTYSTQPLVEDLRSGTINVEAFTEREEEVEVLTTLVEGIDLTNEMSRTIGNFRDVVDETASIPETHNEIISSKNTRESVEVGMDHLKTQERFDGSNNSHPSPNEARFFTAFWAFGTVALCLLLGGLLCVLRQHIRLILNLGNQLNVTDSPV